jgi:hypothetical protein
LTKTDVEEIREVASCRSLVKVGAIAAARPGGRLAAHSADVRFHRAKSGDDAAIRGAVVTWSPGARSGGSGSPGNVYRAQQVQAGKLSKSSSKHIRLRRGAAAVANRKRENAKRKKQKRTSAVRFSWQLHMLIGTVKRIAVGGSFAYPTRRPAVAGSPPRGAGILRAPPSLGLGIFPFGTP